MVENDKRCHQIILQKMCIEFVDRWVRRQHDSFFQEGSALQNQKSLLGFRLSILGERDETPSIDTDNDDSASL